MTFALWCCVSSYEKLAKISATSHFPSTSGSEATPLNAINYVAERKSGLADVAGRTHNTQNCNHFLFIFDVVSQPSIARKVLCSPNGRGKNVEIEFTTFSSSSSPFTLSGPKKEINIFIRRWFLCFCNFFKGEWVYWFSGSHSWSLSSPFNTT